MSVFDAFVWVLAIEFLVFSFFLFTGIWERLIEQWHRKWVRDQATKFSQHLSDGSPYPILPGDLAFWREIAFRLNQRPEPRPLNFDSDPLLPDHKP